MKLPPVVACLCIFIIAPTLLHAQYKKRLWHTYAGPSAGAMYYVGELKKNSWPQKTYTHGSIGARAMTQYKNTIALQVSYTFGGLSGYDSLVNEVLINRGFSFTTRTHDIEMFLKLTLLNHNKVLTRKTKLLVYPKLLAGIGYLNFKPMREYDGRKVDLRALGTEGQHLGVGKYPAPYAKWALGIKLGGEISIYYGPKTTIDFFGYYTFAKTDYLDDVGGGNYIDVDDLLKAEDPALLTALAYAKIYEGAAPESTPSHARGNPETNDGYFNFGVALSYRLTEIAKGNRSNSLPISRRMRW